jgi:hypothetical protein
MTQRDMDYLQMNDGSWPAPGRSFSDMHTITGLGASTGPFAAAEIMSGGK